VKVLLDTHALLWWVTDDQRLSPTARDAIGTSDVAVSVASLWEIEIKRGLGRIEADLGALVREISQTDGFRILQIRPTHVLTLGELPHLHKDPFDRMLVAQAVRDGRVLVTRDTTLAAYPVDVVW
jgi:PIN domain nuclease of toxin-antitoxin system